MFNFIPGLQLKKKWVSIEEICLHTIKICQHKPCLWA